jgi:hypothetical protein
MKLEKGRERNEKGANNIRNIKCLYCNPYLVLFIISNTFKSKWDRINVLSILGLCSSKFFRIDTDKNIR